MTLDEWLDSAPDGGGAVMLFTCRQPMLGTCDILCPLFRRAIQLGVIL